MKLTFGMNFLGNNLTHSFSQTDSQLLFHWRTLYNATDKDRSFNLAQQNYSSIFLNSKKKYVIECYLYHNLFTQELKGVQNQQHHIVLYSVNYNFAIHTIILNHSYSIYFEAFVRIYAKCFPSTWLLHDLHRE